MKEPYKLTPLHAWHARNGAQTSLIDGWMRVSRYGDSQAEFKPMELAVGICDVTPLTKIDIQGKRSGEFLRELAGIPMPEVGDGMVVRLNGYSKSVRVTRLTSDRYWVLASAGIREELSIHLADAAKERACVHTTDVTSAYAAIQLVGPMAMAVLKKLGSAPFDQMHAGECVQTTAARVWSLLIRQEMRQDFAWMLLVSRDYGEYVWESVLTAGREFGIPPLGISAAQAIAGMEEFDVAAL
jgi:methylglutamate dehydrogenase subunit C